jgi:arylsulfatase A
MRRIITTSLGIFGLGSLIFGSSYPKKIKPNILFILIDDLGWQDLHCYGSKFYETPNIDRLSAGGMMFTNAYSACPVSSPTRASILTGKNPARLQFTGHITAIGRHRYPEQGRIIPPQDKMYVALEEVLIPEALKPLGYSTISIGKWHVGDKEKYFPTHQGFDINIAGYAQGSPPTYWAPYKNPELDWNPSIENLDEGKPGEYLTDRLTNEAINFLKVNKEHPFFIYLSHYAVHTPLEVADSLVRKYEKKLESNHSKKNAVYAAMIENVDSNIGRLLSELDKLGLTNNTIIIFYSDNGGYMPATDNTPLREGKGFLYEGGIRVPLIIKWPGYVAGGTLCDEPVISDDLYPTIMEMVGKGVTPVKNIDGLSLVPLLSGEKHLKRDQLCWYYPHYSPQAQMPGYAIRKGNFKLVEHYDPVKIELFNLQEDIGEKNNLAESNPGKVLELRSSFNNWLKRMNPVFHTQNPDYQEGYREMQVQY